MRNRLLPSGVTIIVAILLSQALVHMGHSLKPTPESWQSPRRPSTDYPSRHLKLCKDLADRLDEFRSLCLERKGQVKEGWPDRFAFNLASIQRICQEGLSMESPECYADAKQYLDMGLREYLYVCQHVTTAMANEDDYALDQIAAKLGDAENCIVKSCKILGKDE